MSGPLAQLVEHRTFNPGVEGSNPSWLTIFFNCQKFNLYNLKNPQCISKYFLTRLGDKGILLRTHNQLIIQNL